MDVGTKKPKILFIEDDLTLSSLYTLRMQAEGFEVMAVHEGETALQSAKTFHPDLVLCDLMMPNLSGYDVIDILRNTVETANAKFVVISALSQPEDIEKAKKLGADDYIVKSQVVIDEIMDRLRSLLGLPPSTIKSGI
jgi:DNA-binding response OmpR family regulator